MRCERLFESATSLIRAALICSWGGHGQPFLSFSFQDGGYTMNWSGIFLEACALSGLVLAASSGLLSGRFIYLC